MKKAYALLLTFFLIFIFMYNLSFIFQTKAIGTFNNQNNYLYNQANLHLSFLDSYIRSLKLESICYKNIEIYDDNFFITANLEYNCNKYKIAQVHLFVSSKNEKNSISLHKSFLLNNSTRLNN